MNEIHISTDNPNEPGLYEIRIKGYLDSRWSYRFGDLSIITLEDEGNTLLTGLVVDQAALYGLLKKVRDAGLPLLSVNRIETNQHQTKQHKKEN
jgi:hypothetical protein